MTQFLESSPEVPDCAAVHQSTLTRCFLAESHAGNHESAASSWPQHHVIRLDNGDAERMPRLAQLVYEYDRAKREADDAAARLKAITDGIKAETCAAVPGGTDFTIISGTLDHPLTLVAVTSQRVDTKLLRDMLGDRYSAVCKPSTAWRLAAKK